MSKSILQIWRLRPMKMLGEIVQVSYMSKWRDTKFSSMEDAKKEYTYEDVRLINRTTVGVTATVSQEIERI